MNTRKLRSLALLLAMLLLFAVLAACDEQPSTLPDPPADEQGSAPSDDELPPSTDDAPPAEDSPIAPDQPSEEPTLPPISDDPEFDNPATDDQTKRY
jgi:hypothetical protein